MLGKYELLRKIAMGGMAEIYLARVRGTAGFEKLVVIKRILPNVADEPKFVNMFLDEARLAATLQHPNIADVYEAGSDEGTPFFAMEFVHGQDVRSIRIAAAQRKERVPLAVALAIVHGTASALDYAHDRVGSDGRTLGLVHRDVSPSNILVSYDGAIKLIDFGIARASITSHQTQTGTLKGKIPYMSPEQCRGLPIDRRSDLFSLGVLMYELTTSRRPFRGDTDFAIMDQIVHRGAAPPSTVMRGYPPELEAIVMRLLAPTPEKRYQTAEQMLHDLDPFLAEHRLWVSPKQLSRYMRAQFANAVIAWDKAIEDGVTLAQHLAGTTTSESNTSGLVTPPSAFPAVMPLSQEMPIVRPSGEIDLDDERTKLATPTAAQSAPTLPLAVEYPQLKRSGGKLVFAFVGALALGAGGYVAFEMLQPPEAQAPAAIVAPAPVAPVKLVEPAPVKPAAKPTVEPIEPPQTPVVAPPEPTAAPPPVPVVEKKAVKPVKKRPVVVKPPPVKDKDEPAKPPEPPKDQKDPGWTQDSPFLPPHK